MNFLPKVAGLLATVKKIMTSKWMNLEIKRLALTYPTKIGVNVDTVKTCPLRRNVCVARKSHRFSIL